MVPAALKAGSDLAYCLPPTLSPLPVSVHTRSLNLPQKQQNLAPLYFYFPFIIVSLTPFIVFVRLAYHVHLAYSQPLRSLSGGE